MLGVGASDCNYRDISTSTAGNTPTCCGVSGLGGVPKPDAVNARAVPGATAAMEARMMTSPIKFATFILPGCSSTYLSISLSTSQPPVRWPAVWSSMLSSPPAVVPQYDAAPSESAQHPYLLLTRVYVHESNSNSCLCQPFFLCPLSSKHASCQCMQSCDRCSQARISIRRLFYVYFSQSETQIPTTRMPNFNL